MIGGYMGTILKINLSTKEVKKEKLDQELAKKYIGGSGMGAKLLFDMVDENTDPLGPENPLIFINGPFAGTNIPTSGRHAVATRSPLTGIWAEGDVGGTWGMNFKKAGYDALILKGKAEKPVYIWINDDNVEIRNAEDIWGKDNYEIENILREETDEDAVVKSIGLAGENLIPYANINTDGDDARSFGRCGAGAVMGSKNLKALVVKGTKEVPIANPEKLKDLIKSNTPQIVEETKMFGKYGTPGGIEGHEETRNFPLKNWKQERWPEGAKKINGIKMEETILTGRYYCGSCVIGCGREVKIEDSPYSKVDGAGPEYETIGTLGGLCLVDDLKAISKGNELCNRYGIDTISIGNAISFGMEAYERGILTLEDTDGIELEFGNAEAMLQTIEKIVNKDGRLGNLLSQGVKKASEELGGIAKEFAIHVKGLEFPAHDPRAYNGVALSYATSNRGACHLQGFTHGFEKSFTMPEIGLDEPHDRHKSEGKAKITADLQNIMCLFDSLKACKFLFIGGVKLTLMKDWFNAVTGLDYTNEDLLKIGERMYNLKRIFNNRCGISRKDDTLPPRILSLKRGPNLPPLGKMLGEYYDYRKWNEFGQVTKDKAIELGIEEEWNIVFN